MGVVRDGREWRVGTALDVQWIRAATAPGPTIASAIPAVFDAYATIVERPTPSESDDPERIFARAVLERLTAQQPDAVSWWLGYLDTGSNDVVFPDAPRVSLYANWQYVFVQAGPEQAASWRNHLAEPALPEVIFPENRSWLLSTLWDDTWTCLGGSSTLIDQLRQDNRLLTEPVSLRQDMAPAGHRMN